MDTEKEIAQLKQRVAELEAQARQDKGGSVGAQIVYGGGLSSNYQCTHCGQPLNRAGGGRGHNGGAVYEYAAGGNGGGGGGRK